MGQGLCKRRDGDETRYGDRRRDRRRDRDGAEKEGQAELERAQGR
jgi:hypothetical protein